MPTSSQAMIVMTDEGEDLRLSRKTFPTSISNLPCTDQDRSCSHHSFAISSGFPGIVDAHGYLGTMAYDIKTKCLRWQVINKDFKPIAPAADSKLTPERPPATIHCSSDGTNSSEEETRRRLESLGFRRRIPTPNSNAKKDNDKCSATFVHDAKYLSTPTETQPRPVISITLPSAQEGFYGDGCVDENSTKEKPKSLLDMLKESISYGNRFVPSMELRKYLPPPSPTSVVFSLRNNEDYTHKDIKDLIESETGFKVVSIQYDPVNVRAGSADILGRWIVEFGCVGETLGILQDGLEINDDKVIVKLLDDVHKMEYEAYRLLMEERRKLKDSEAQIYLHRKSRKNRTGSRHNGRIKI